MNSDINVKDGSALLLISAGPYYMGSEEGTAPERPRHEVELDEFRISQNPITNAQYHAFVSATGHRIPHLDDPRVERENWDPSSGTPPAGREMHPVVLVSWYDAVEYCRWAGGRLPTECEWERAARGGLHDEPFPWGKRVDRTLANYDSRDGTTPVGKYPSNRFGLNDMAGNVWEWVSDWYDAGYYGVSPKRSPTGPEAGTTKVLRGGAWLLFPEFCRTSYRFRNNPKFRFNLIGFRLATEA